MDTAGQETFNSQNRIYYRIADCCLLVYDITNLKSFKEISDYYIKEIKDNCKKGIKVILIGNKTDLENRVVSKEEGANLAAKNGFYFNETSAEVNYNVADSFETLILMTNTEMIKTNTLNIDSAKNKFKINTDTGKVGRAPAKKKKCC